MVNQEWRKDVRIFKYLHIFSFFKIFKGLSFLGISNGQYKRYPRSLQLSSKINVDAGECPTTNPLTDAECAGAVSNCWSPGQLDTDCPNYGLCCFDGCANTCVDDIAPEPTAEAPLSSYLPPAPSAPAPAPPAPLPTYESASQGTEAPPMMVMDASYNFNFDK